LKKLVYFAFKFIMDFNENFFELIAIEIINITFNIDIFC